MYELEAGRLAAAMVAAFLVGVSKTGVAGTGILAVLIMAWALPARASTGVVLPMLISADIFAVAFYRRRASWGHILRLMPWAMAGIIAGYLVMDRVTDAQLRPAIGLIVILLLAVNRLRNLGPGEPAAPTARWFSAGTGLLAGSTTMLANAAGPVMIFYLLSMKLPRFEFIGTAAWYFFILNLFKVPFSADLGLINPDSLRLNLILLPGVAAGALAGILIIRKLPEKTFAVVVEILAFAAAIRLLATA